MSEPLYLTLVAASLVLNGYVLVRNCLPGHRACQESRLRSDGYAPPWFMGWAYWIGVDVLLFRHKMHPQCLICEHPETDHALRGTCQLEDWRTCQHPGCDCLSGLFLFEKQKPAAVGVLPGSKP